MNENTITTSELLLKDRRAFLRGSAVAVGAGAIVASTLRAQTTTANPDIAVLNYALTLEHLEAAFYNQGLARFNAADFGRSASVSVLGSALTANVFSYLGKIRDHENAHVETITTVIRSLGGTPVSPCTYRFPYNNADEFLMVAATLENTGVYAYNGAIASIQSKELQTAAATITTVEARHASYLNLITGAIPFPMAFDLAKSMQEILATAQQFISACPTPPPGTGTPTGTAAVLLPKNLTTVSQYVQLDARTSVSGNGQPLTYSLRQISGNSAAIQNANSATPTVQFFVRGPHVFELTVTDTTGTTATDRVTIDYQGN